MSGGAPYPPPTILPIYNSSNFVNLDNTLTYNEANQVFFKNTGGSISGAVNVNNTTQSTSRTTGALTVAGGLGVDLDTHMNNLHLNNTASELKLSGVNSYLNINNNTSLSTGLTSGAIRCAGGAYFGNNSIINGNLALTGSGSKLQFTGTNSQINLINNSSTSFISIENTSNSIDNASGAIRCGGGAGFGGSCFLSGLTAGGSNDFDFSGSTGQFRTTTGPMIIGGTSNNSGTIGYSFHKKYTATTTPSNMFSIQFTNSYGACFIELVLVGTASNVQGVANLYYCQIINNGTVGVRLWQNGTIIASGSNLSVLNGSIDGTTGVSISFVNSNIGSSNSTITFRISSGSGGGPCSLYARILGGGDNTIMNVSIL
jgi:hypothetical protein